MPTSKLAAACTKAAKAEIALEKAKVDRTRLYNQEINGLAHRLAVLARDAGITLETVLIDVEKEAYLAESAHLYRIQNRNAIKEAAISDAVSRAAIDSGYITDNSILTPLGRQKRDDLEAKYRDRRPMSDREMTMLRFLQHR